MNSSTGPAAGWYPDPAAPDTQRYWAGDEWLGEPIAIDAPVPATPPTRPAPPPPTPVAAPTTATDTARSTTEPPGTSSGWSPGQAGTPPVESPASVGTRPEAPGRQPGGAGSSWRRPGPNGIELPPVPPGHIRVPGSTAVIAIDEAKLAPLGLRLAARLLDLVAITLLCLVVNSYFLVRLVREIEPVTAELQRGSAADLPPNASRLMWTILIISVALWFAYEVPGTANSGQTLGKRMVGIKVVRVVDDKALTFGQSFRRWLILMLLSPIFSSICGLPFLLADVLWCLWDRPARQCLHDKAVTSIVVRAPEPSVVGSPPGGPPAGPPREGPPL
jgi:uncharacterized RDD family membrane protein YckC